jgi:2-C-methyl-D-erythritol 4-phosphate cytidylyltransferase
MKLQPCDFYKYFGKHNGYDKHKEIALQLLKETIDILNENNINYFIISGTLLGYIRHNNIIPWDDDIDLIVDKKILLFLDIIRQKYNSIIFANKENWIIKTCFRKEIIHIPENVQCIKFSEKYNFPYIDLFLYHHDTEQNKLLFFNKLWDASYFFPNRLVDFCNLNVSIPNDPHYFLFENYGNTYMSMVTSKNWNHKNESGIQDIKTISYLDYQNYANKPSLLMDFEWINIKNNLIVPKYVKTNGSNIGIILAAGFSSRFNNVIMKQIYYLNHKKIIEYSVESMESIDDIIIVCNNKCYNDINELYNANNKITILINNIDCRIQSIKTALNFIDKYKTNIKNIIIHDSARPFIKKKHIDNILKICENEFLYSQYCLKLTNGLIKKNTKNTKNIEFVDRNEYTEVCTPICINYELASFIFKNYIDNNDSITSEFLPIIDIMNIEYKLLFENTNVLKKITVIEDIEDIEY